MFSYLFVWCFIIFSCCVAAFERGVKSANAAVEGGLPLANLYVNIGFYAEIIFLILGFFFMPHWWYPLALYGIVMLVNAIPILDVLWSVVGWVAIPVCGVVMYLNLFEVI